MWKSKSAGDSAGGWKDDGGGWSSGDGWISRYASASFTPPDLPGLVLWLESTQGLQLSGSNVREWVDQSPAGGNNALQVTGAKKPGYTASDASFNGKPSVNFDGAAQYMTFVTNSLLIAPCTVIVCGNTTAQTGQGDILFDENSVEVVVSAAPSQLVTYAGTALVAPIPTSAPFVAALVFDGATSTIYQNAPFAPIAAGDTGANATGGTPMFLGSGAGAGNYYEGSLVEVLIYNSVLSAEQLTRVFEYLKNKYAVAAVELTFTSPKSLQGCQMWLDAAHVTLGTPPAVASMQDQSGNGNDAAQLTVGDRPTLVANAINGLPAVNFAESPLQWLVHPLSAQVMPFSVWSVLAAKQPAGGQYQCLYGNADGVTFASQDGLSTDKWGIYLSAIDSSASEITSPGGNIYHSTTLVAPHAGSLLTFSTDGVLDTMVTAGAGGYSANAGTIGGGVSNQPFDGSVAELATWSRVLTLPEIALLEGYSLKKYGVG